MMDEDRNAPATKGDLLDMRDGLRQEISGQISGLRDELVEAIHDSQTEVLRAFYGFSQTIQARFAQQDQTEAALKQRLTVIESRVLEIEKRLNMPPGGV